MNARDLLNIIRVVLVEGKRHLSEPNQDIADIEKILSRYPFQGDCHVSGRQDRIKEARIAQSFRELSSRYLKNHV